jgi:hypothetical protein
VSGLQSYIIAILHHCNHTSDRAPNKKSINYSQSHSLPTMTTRLQLYCRSIDGKTTAIPLKLHDLTGPTTMKSVVELRKTEQELLNLNKKSLQTLRNLKQIRALTPAEVEQMARLKELMKEKRSYASCRLVFVEGLTEEERDDIAERYGGVAGDGGWFFSEKDEGYVWRDVNRTVPAGDSGSSSGGAITAGGAAAKGNDLNANLNADGNTNIASISTTTSGNETAENGILNSNDTAQAMHLDDNESSNESSRLASTFIKDEPDAKRAKKRNDNTINATNNMGNSSASTDGNGENRGNSSGANSGGSSSGNSQTPQVQDSDTAGVVVFVNAMLIRALLAKSIGFPFAELLQLSQETDDGSLGMYFNIQKELTSQSNKTQINIQKEL